MDLGERLRRLRELRGFTLEEVGNHLEVNKATVQRYESGNIDIKRNVAIKLAEKLKVHPSYIMGWTNSTSVNGNSTFSRKLREARVKKNLTSKQVIEHIGVCDSTYSGYEGGWLQPDIETIISLSKLLDTSVAELFGLDSASDAVNSLSDDEVELINHYRKLDENGQDMTFDYIGFLINTGKYTSVHVTKAARSDNHTAPEILDISIERIKRLDDAPEADEL